MYIFAIPGIQGDKMDPIHSDPRFSKLGKDRKFLSVSKKHKKVKIDKRFQSLFSNDKFVSKCTVDKRGRPKSLSSKESYEKFYDLEESDTSEDSDEPKDDDEDEGESEENTAINLPSVVDDPVIESDIKSKLLSSNIDYARGEADLYSDSSSEEDSDSEEEAGQEEEDAQFFDKWGELDGEAERTEDATDRLAVCNMDWDRVGADDIFLVIILLHSNYSLCRSSVIYRSCHPSVLQGALWTVCRCSYLTLVRRGWRRRKLWGQGS